VRGDRGADDGPRECGGCAVDRNGSADGRTLSAWEWEETIEKGQKVTNHRFLDVGIPVEQVLCYLMHKSIWK
jgi:hypothetical protein